MYVTDDPRFTMLTAARWYAAPAVMEFVAGALGADFSVVQQRRMVLDRLTALKLHSAPYAKDRRFRQGTFVCETTGDWARKFTQLRSALVTRDHAKDHGSHAQLGRGEANDAQQAYYNALLAIQAQLITMDGVWSRDNFEAVFDAEWTFQYQQPQPQIEVEQQE